MGYSSRASGRKDRARLARADAALIENGTESQMWDVVLTEARRLASAWEGGLEPERRIHSAQRLVTLLIALRNRGDQWQMRL
jgi:hypothetical protein